jgi:hypothetical protein
MRSKSEMVDGFQVFAVTGVNTISFAIEADAPARKGLLGFAVERADPTGDERFFMFGCPFPLRECRQDGGQDDGAVYSRCGLGV